jgi:hypothetical protein
MDKAIQKCLKFEHKSKKQNHELQKIWKNRLASK